MAFLAVLFICMGHLAGLDSISGRSEANLAKAFQKDLQKLSGFQENLLAQTVERVAQLNEDATTEDLFKAVNGPIRYVYRDKRVAILVYKNQQLQCWSDNHVPTVENLSARRNYSGGKVFNQGNGWYLPKVAEQGDYTIVSLLLLKKDFEFQNKYLRNNFNPNFDMPADWKVSTDSVAGHTNIPVSLSEEGEALFYLIPSPETEREPSTAGIVAFVIGLLLIVILFGGLASWVGNKTKPWIGWGFLAFSLVLVRIVMQAFNYPALLCQSALFDPAYYASSDILPSLGDLFLNVALLCYLAWYFNRKVPINISEKITKNSRIMVGVGLFLIGMLLLLPVTNLLKSLVLNSSIAFDLNDLFSLDIFSVAGYLVSAILLLAYYFVVEKMVLIVGKDNLKYSGVSLAIAAGVFVAVAIGSGKEGLLTTLCILVFAVVMAEKLVSGARGVFGTMALILVFGIFSSYQFIHHLAEKEKNERIYKAGKISEDRDPVAEYLFTEISETITQDRILKNYLTILPAKSEDFTNRVIQDFLNDYRQKYDININIYNNKDSLLISSVEDSPERSFYTRYLRDGLSTASNYLIYNRDYADKITYLARIPFNISRNEALHDIQMFIEFREKTITPESGFLELLIDAKISPNYSMEKYSYARYVNGMLVSHHGTYPYASRAPENQSEDETAFYESGDFNHLVYKPNDQVDIIVSKPVGDQLQVLTSFSFLFLFYALFIVLLLLMSLYGNSREYLRDNFKNRINMAILSVLTIFLVLIGGGTIYYVLQQYDNKNEEVLFEKMQSVSAELSQKLTNKAQLDESTTDYLTYILTKFSKVFFTDINLYDLEGNLLASSRSRIFDESLISRKMDENAFQKVALEGRANFIHDESIGKLRYLSAYVPFYNDDDKLLAYVNLPFFAKQKGLEQELQSLLSALINAYVLLILLAIVMTLFITERISEPLRVISDNLRKVKLGQTNQPIQWQSRDEIGTLISEYNRVISELQHSAELLAKSERESAWREMAKQVAHEIKNPLTPMKLSVQQLQRAYTEQKPNWDKNIERVTQILIEQIDTLSDIASEFSSFAKMPKPENKLVKVASLLENVAELYKESEGVKLTFKSQAEENTYIFADENQVQRAFNNLVQNAIQAIPDDREGEININLEVENGYVLIRIEDNGIGIDESVKDKIFVPNFTTKTGGMGLGLAMVRNIIESAAGEIWFETEIGEGTTFFIRLKRVKGE